MLPSISEGPPESSEDEAAKAKESKQASVKESLAILNEKPTEYRMEKKTIMDEINKKPVVRYLFIDF